MFWLTNLLGTDVVELANARRLGVIDRFGFEKNQNCVTVHTASGWFLLKGLFSCLDVLMVEQCQPLPQMQGDLLNCQIFDTLGRYLSTVKDVFVDRQSLLKKITTAEDKLLPLAKIFSIGDVVLLKNRLPKGFQNTSNAQSNVQSRPSKQTQQHAPQYTQNNTNSQPVEQNTVEIFNQTGEKSQLSAVVEISENEQKSTDEVDRSGDFLEGNVVAEQQNLMTTAVKNLSGNVKKHYGDFNFLLGRTCKKDITNFQGEVMVKQNSVINKEVLRQAKISGKLIELALNC